MRLPAVAAQGEHVRVVRDGDAVQWEAIAAITIDGVARDAGSRGAVGDGMVVIGIGAYRIAISRAAPGAIAATPQRTASLARELVRSLLGDGGAPALEVEHGPQIGARRALPPPECAVVIGRGDEAGWVILDEDLSRTHAEIRRTWSGVRIVDLGSKNGTRVGGELVDERDGVALHDGDVIELGKVRLRFRDPAERHLGGAPAVRAAVAPAVVAPVVVAATTRSRAPMFVAIAIAVAAIAALVWLVVG